MTRLGGERGSATVEMVVVMPLLMLVVWIGMGAAMFYYGKNAAIASAQAGATAAAAEHGTTGACQVAALDLARRVGDALGNVQVSCTRGANSATATVSGVVLSLVPGWAPSLSQTATVPREKVT